MNDTFPLWLDGTVPGAFGIEATDTPTLTVFPVPEGRANGGAAVIVFPGGGYWIHADHEADPLALWANDDLGATGFVLRYRLGQHGYRHPIMLGDAQRAVRTVRSRAVEFGIDTKKIGVLGFSAGGHLAATLATHHDAGDPNAADPIERESCRPDFAVLVYPVISFVADYAHAGSAEQLLGKSPDPELLRLLSTDTQVTPETPPCYLVHSTDDSGVPVQNSLSFAMALANNGVPFGMSVFAHGGHGYGMADGQTTGAHTAKADPYLRRWPSDCADWLRKMGFSAE